MFVSIHNKAVIDLIGKDDQLMLSCNVRDLLQDLLRIYGTCRVIWIDDNDRFGPWCDLTLAGARFLLDAQTEEERQLHWMQWLCREKLQKM